MKIGLFCKVCKKPFLKQQCWVQRTKQHFCSKECHDLYQGSHKLIKICKICRKRFSVRKCEFNKYSTCSRQCYIKAKSKENNGNWQGGIASPRKIGMSVAIYKKWQESVFSRDNYTCQSCGKIGGDLNAHHILPWSVFPSLRYTLENGKTLCELCHKKTYKEVKMWKELRRILG